jgi:hypothetical protein
MYGWVTVTVVVIAISWLAWSWRAKRESMTDADVATIIQHYVRGGGKYSEWGDFVETRFRNPRLERLRSMCWEAESKPARERERFLAELIEKLRSGQFS